ncbi:MAG: non-canonical purine NTP phosphatase [Anaerolineaceae bacterium]|nr:non-canonical purine NTP phosphatase [Anaerolineaceae bacterium]
MKLIVASTNPVKIQSALHGFRLMFPDQIVTTEGVSVPSGVSDQPMSDEETLQGAFNRASSIRASHPDADYWVGIEGGCEEKHSELWTFAWVVVQSSLPRLRGRVREGVLTGKARTGAFMLPQEVASLVRQGVELGIADDRVFGRSNSKQSNGAVGLLTADLIDRQRYYEHAVILALVPFKNVDLTWGKAE